MLNIQRRIHLFIIVCAVTFFVPSICHAEYFSINTSYQVCFTPGQDCTQMVVDEIAKAKKEILVQMYIFTNHKIAKALLEAKRRKVDVKVLLDKDNVSSKYSVVRFFNNNNIPVHIDCVKEGRAHNKLLMIDESATIGGSFNYTNSAQKRNLENVTIIRDPIFTKKFVDNWHDRYSTSVAVKKPKASSRKKR